MTKLLTAAEVAERLNLRLGRVYELGRLGILPCVKLRRQVRFPEDQLERFISQRGSPDGHPVSNCNLLRFPPGAQ